jgi:four helix bundle protein
MAHNQVRRFEDLEAWKSGREVTRTVYSLTKKDSFKRDFGLVDQIRRAAASVMTNVAEGFERGTNKDFIRFLFIARGSAGEVRSLLYVALDQGYITEKEFSSTQDLCVQASRIIWGLIKSLRNKSGWVTGLKILALGLFLRLGITQL